MTRALTVPTLATSDVPPALQMLASMQARIWVGDVKSAFTQGIKGQRPEMLFAMPPKDGLPGEDEDVLIELLAEVYGLITGPPGWQKSLVTTLSSFGLRPTSICSSRCRDV